MFNPWLSGTLSVGICLVAGATLSKAILVGSTVVGVCVVANLVIETVEQRRSEQS